MLKAAKGKLKEKYPFYDTVVGGEIPIKRGIFRSLRQSKGERRQSQSVEVS